MAILNALTGANSASASGNQGQSSSWSNTAGLQASQNSAQQAALAHQRQLELLKETQEYNAREAQKQREWQEKMANTVYTRSVANMKQAGINPILAAQLGLSGSSVGSGATASVSTPTTYMGQSFAEQNSASQSSQSGWGWSNSSSGLAEGLKMMGDLISSALGSINSAQNIEISLAGLENLFSKEDGFKVSDGTGEKIPVKEYIDDKARQVGTAVVKPIQNIFEKLGGVKGSTYYNAAKVNPQQKWRLE